VPPRGGTGDSSTVARTGSKTGRVDGPWVHEPRVGVRFAACNREKPGARRRAWQGYRAPRARLRDKPDPGSLMEKALEGDNPRRAPAERPSPAKARVERNGPSGGAKLRSGRAVRRRRARRSRGVDGTCVALSGASRRPDSATARNRRPGSRAGVAGKAIVKHLGTPRRTKDGERTRTEATTRESGHGSPRRESSGGAAPGREPSEKAGRRRAPRARVWTILVTPNGRTT